MFLAALKELNLFVLPKPNFDIPASDFDLTCSQPRTGDSDLSCVSHTFDMQQFNQIRSNAGTSEDVFTSRKRRRNTISFPLHKARESFWPRVSLDKRPPSTANGSDSFPSIAELQPMTRFSNGIASIMHTRSSESSSGAKVRIVTPANSPSSIRRRLREDLVSLYGSSPNRDRSRTHGSQIKVQTAYENKANISYVLSRKGKEKRYSAPALFPSGVAQTNEEPISPIRLPPPVVQKYQNPPLRPHQDIVSNPSYPSKLFELDLSPIIEDVYVFSDQQPALFTKGAQTDVGSVDSPLDSSTTSYGELLYDKSADCFGLPDFDLSGNSYYDKKNQWTETVGHRESQEWQGIPLTSMREETVKNGEHHVPGNIVPELTLTLSTPAFDCSTEFINFGVEALREQTCGELPQSSCDLCACIDFIDEAQKLRAPPPSVHSCYHDDDALQIDLDSHGTMDTLSRLDLVASSKFVDGNVLDLDRSRDRTPVIRPASLVAHTGRARHPSANHDAPVLDDPATSQLGKGFSRFGRYLLQRANMFSLSGNKHCTSNSNSKKLRSLKRVIHVFSVYSDQPPKSRDSAALDDPTGQDSKIKKNKQATDKASLRGTLISFVRRGRT